MDEEPWPPIPVPGKQRMMMMMITMKLVATGVTLTPASRTNRVCSFLILWLKVVGPYSCVWREKDLTHGVLQKKKKFVPNFEVKVL